jgi:HK97 family phage portal protein
MEEQKKKRAFLSWLFRPKAQQSVTQSGGTMDHDLMKKVSRGGDVATSGKVVTDESAMGVSAAWACRRILSETIGAIPWGMYKKDAKGNSEPAHDHPLHEVLTASPNSEQTPVEFKEMKVMGLTGTGNAYSYIDRLGGRVASLTPFETRVKPMRKGPGVQSKLALRDGEVFFRVFTGASGHEDLPRDKVWQVKGFGNSRLEGLSPIGAAREAMGAAMAAEEFANRFFLQGGFPAGIVTIPNILKDDQREVARENLRQMVTGLGKSHSFALFENGMKPEPWEPMNLEDMQFIMVRKFSVLEVCRFFRVPPHMVAELEKGASYASIEQMSQDFVMFTLLPYFTRFEAACTKWLLTPKDRAQGYYLRFNFEGLLRADSKSRAEFLSTMVNNGMMSRNEARAKENLNRVADKNMDAYTVQTAMIPIEKLGEQQKPAPLPPGRPREDAEEAAPQKKEKAEASNNQVVQAAIALPESMAHHVRHEIPVVEEVRVAVEHLDHQVKGLAGALVRVAEGQTEVVDAVIEVAATQQRLGRQIAESAERSASASAALAAEFERMRTQEREIEVDGETFVSRPKAH